MKLKSHIFIASNIYHYLKEELHLELDQAEFFRGAVLPDLQLAERKHVHDFKRSLKVLKHYLTEIDDKSFTVSELSLRLGVMTHYICDSFCLAHNNFHNNVFRHTKYELQMNRVIKKITMNPSFKKDLFEYLDLEDHDKVDWIKQFTKAHDIYIHGITKGMNDNVLRDLYFSFAIGSAMIAYMYQRAEIPLGVEVTALA